MASHFPKDVQDQQYFTVSAIPAGFLYLPDRVVFDDALESDTGQKVPSFSFLLEHNTYGRILFDLGNRKGGKGYPPAMAEDLKLFQIDCEKDIVDLLEARDIKPKDIRTVVYSHLHFDHVGDLSPFSKSLLVMGGDAAERIKLPYPQNPDSLISALPYGQNVQYIDFATKESISLGPFESAIDFLEDGSLYLIDARGHTPGHLAALVRVGSEQFVLLAGDCCHNRQCYNPGERLISRYNHEDIETARKTVENLKVAGKMTNVIVILAHEKERLDEMPLFPETLNGWAIQEMTENN